MSVGVGAMITAASFRSLALIRSRPVDLLILRADSCFWTDKTSIFLNLLVELTCGGWSEWNVFGAHFCLIAFARDIPILVKKLLKREAMVFEVLWSTSSDTTECVPRDVSSFKVFHKPEGLLFGSTFLHHRI